jgi:hypothetical protein
MKGQRLQPKTNSVPMRNSFLELRKGKNAMGINWGERKNMIKLEVTEWKSNVKKNWD